MLPVRVIGGPGRRYRQREQEGTTRKKDGPLAAECERKTRKPVSTKWNASACRCREVHANAAVRGGRVKQREFYQSRPISRQKAQVMKAISR
jgi:hypothetical protein